MKYLVVLVLAAFVVLCASQPAPQVETYSQKENDYRTLNYALTLEHLEATFYTEGLQIFNESSFDDAGFIGARPYFNLIRAHEQSHVELLTTVLQSAGAHAVGACVYDFSAAFSSVRNFVATARVLEITGTMAYDGAANTINNAAYLQVAATIATVEARHSAFLNYLEQLSPFNSSFEVALSPAEVIAAAKGFFVSCPDNLTLPNFAYEYVPLSSSYTYYNKSGQEETSEQIENDNDVLNYALTLELFGHAFYSSAARFTQSDFTNAGYGDVYPYFQMIIMHENAHVDFLTTTLESRGALRARPCTYNLGTNADNVQNALNFARMLENLEVTAYDGAINDLTDHQLIQGAATIATVEARHGEYLNNVLLGIPVNNESLDTANAPAQILNITAPFFEGDCVAPAVPVMAYTLQAYGTQPVPSSSTAPTATPTTCPGTPTPTPTCGATTPTPTPTCGGCSSNDDDDGVTINFYFADMLRGL